MQHPDEKPGISFLDEKPAMSFLDEKQKANQEKDNENSDGKDAQKIPDQTMSNDVVNIPHLERHRRSITNKWQ